MNIKVSEVCKIIKNALQKCDHSVFKSLNPVYTLTFIETSRHIYLKWTFVNSRTCTHENRQLCNKRKRTIHLIASSRGLVNLPEHFIVPCNNIPLYFLCGFCWSCKINKTTHCPQLSDSTLVTFWLLVSESYSNMTCHAWRHAG